VVGFLGLDVAIRGVVKQKKTATAGSQWLVIVENILIREVHHIRSIVLVSFLGQMSMEHFRYIENLVQCPCPIGYPISARITLLAEKEFNGFKIAC
jgi:hypothetical protein